MIDDEGTHRARRVGGSRAGGPTAMRVATPRVEPRRRDRREPFEPDSRTASGAAGRPAGGSPGVRPRTRGSPPTIPAGPQSGTRPAVEIPWPQVDGNPGQASLRGSGLVRTGKQDGAVPPLVIGAETRACKVGRRHFH